MTSKVDPLTVRVEIFIMVVDYKTLNIGIQMERIELNKTFMMIFKLKNPMVSMVNTKKIQRFRLIGSTPGAHRITSVGISPRVLDLYS